VLKLYIVRHMLHNVLQIYWIIQLPRELIELEFNKNRRIPIKKQFGDPPTPQNNPTLIGGSHVRRPGSEDPHWRERNLYILFVLNS
jgi:hypothetical protein